MSAAGGFTEKDVLRGQQGALMCLLACGASNAGLNLRVFVVTE